MALVLLDSFDHYNILTEKWTAAGGASIDLTNSYGRTGIGACMCQGEGPSLTVSALSGCVMGSGYNTQGMNGDIFGVISGTTRQVRLQCNSNGSVSIVTGNDPTPNLLGTSAPSLVIPGSYSYWEMKISAFSSTGNVIVRRNGLIVLNIIGNTNPDATGTFTQWYLCGPTAPGTAAHDDSCLCDLVDSGIPGQPNNDFLGPIHVFALIPTSDATPLQWTPNTGSTHFTQVRAIPPNFVNSVLDATTGHVDQYTFSAKPIAPLPVSIVGVQGTLLSAADSIVSGVSVAPDMGAVAGTGVALTTTFSMIRKTYDGNPVTSLPWALDDFVTVPFGPKVTASAPTGAHYVAIARNAPTAEQVMRSTDAVTWEAISTPTDNQGGTCIASFGAGKFCALCFASDGVTWIAITSTDGGATWTSHAVTQPGGGFSYVDMVFGGGLLVGIASDGTVITSPDGATWINSASIPGFAPISITFGGGLYVSVGNSDADHAIATSPDAAAWTIQNTAIGGNPNLDWSGICSGGGQYVAVSKFALDPFGIMTVMNSPNGTAWTGHAQDGTDPVPVSAVYVAFGAGLYVAPSDGQGPGTGTYTSADGDTWVGHAVAEFPVGSPQRIRFLNSLFLICCDAFPGPPAIVTGSDGLAWTAQTTPIDRAQDVAYG